MDSALFGSFSCQGKQDGCVTEVVTRRDLHDATLPDRVAALLRDHGVSPAWLRLELTESALMAEP